MIKLQEKTPNQKFRQKIEELLGVLFGDLCESQVSALLRSRQPFLYVDSEDDDSFENHEWRCFSVLEALCDIVESHGEIEQATAALEQLIKVYDGNDEKL